MAGPARRPAPMPKPMAKPKGNIGTAIQGYPNGKTTTLGKTPKPGRKMS